mmetsp:Transcript_66853/g.145805  ORF Transcript_66853/g.145805 Transcript_66853/m.145805 type:complete len:126 (+) Transcript_66853:103-480(+)
MPKARLHVGSHAGNSPRQSVHSDSLPLAARAILEAAEANHGGEQMPVKVYYCQVEELPKEAAPPWASSQGVTAYSINAYSHTAQDRASASRWTEIVDSTGQRQTGRTHSRDGRESTEEETWCSMM